MIQKENKKCGLLPPFPQDETPQREAQQGHQEGGLGRRRAGGPGRWRK